MKAIDSILIEEPGIESLKLQSFSWFEVSLMLFGDDPQQIANVIQKPRRLTIENLLKVAPDILDESLYKMLFIRQPKSSFEHANIFADTHTYIGIHSDVFDQDNTVRNRKDREGCKCDAMLKFLFIQSYKIIKKIQIK